MEEKEAFRSEEERQKFALFLHDRESYDMLYGKADDPIEEEVEFYHPKSESELQALLAEFQEQETTR